MDRFFASYGPECRPVERSDSIVASVEVYLNKTEDGVHVRKKRIGDIALAKEDGTYRILGLGRHMRRFDGPFPADPDDPVEFPSFMTLRDAKLAVDRAIRKYDWRMTEMFGWQGTPREEFR